MNDVNENYYKHGWCRVDENEKIIKSGDLPPVDDTLKCNNHYRSAGSYNDYNSQHDYASRMRQHIKENTWTVGDAVYGRCAGCGQVVHINKRFFGSLHFCNKEGNGENRQYISRHNSRE